MKVLLDTCAFLWLVTNDSEHLTETAKNTFLNEENEIFFSLVSAWEISIKASIGKLNVPLPVHNFLTLQIELNQLSVLPLKLSHVTKIYELPFRHKDPFDRLLIAQAIIEELPILTGDSVFDSYNVRKIWE
jgi:PIN domain nuclease of toxin-antitoxin system